MKCFVLFLFLTIFSCQINPAPRDVGIPEVKYLINATSSQWRDTLSIACIESYNSDAFNINKKKDDLTPLRLTGSKIYDNGSWSMMDTINHVQDSMIELYFKLGSASLATTAPCGLRIVFVLNKLLRKNWSALAFELKADSVNSKISGVTLETATAMKGRRYRTANIYELSNDWKLYILPIEWENDGIPNESDYYLESAITLITGRTSVKEGRVYIRRLLALKNRNVIPLEFEYNSIIQPISKEEMIDNFIKSVIDSN